MANFNSIEEYVAAIDKAINLIDAGISDAVERAAGDMAGAISARNVNEQENRFGGKNRPYTNSYASFRRGKGMSNEFRSFRLSGIMWGGFGAQSKGKYTAVITFTGAHSQMAEYNDKKDPGFDLPSEKETINATGDIAAFVLDTLAQVGIAEKTDNVL